MLVYKIDKKKYKDVFPPRGSLHSDGRWSRRDMWVVYTSENIALAKLEALANSGRKIPKNRILRIINIKDDAPIIEITPDDLPSNWAATPYPKGLANIIRRIIESKSFVAAIVPSVQSKRERSMLLLPDFPEFEEHVQEEDTVDEYFDPRLKKEEASG